MSFNRLIGQQKVKSILTEAAVSGRLGHAYMFVGPEGIGKKSFADEFAKLIMCGGRRDEEDEPCGRCESCVLLGQGFNPDCVREDVPQGKASISVDAVREIQEKITTAPAYGRKKVVIIANADKMTVQAQNALLKTLEEPPEYVVIILLCANKTMMLETVKSRVVTVEFSRNTDEEVRQYYLSNDPEATKEKLALVCAYADGIIGRAEQIGEGKETEEIRQAVPEIIETAANDKFAASKQLSGLLTKSEDSKAFVFFTLRSFYRDIQIAARYGSKSELMNPDFRETIARLAGKIGYHKAARNAEIVDETWRMLGRNANLKLATDRMIIHLQ